MTISKTTKRLVSLLLLIILSVSLIVPAHALTDSSWENKFAGLVNVSKTKPHAGCVRILQRFLTCYSDSSRWFMYNGDNNPISGVFNENTYNAVVSMQNNEHLVADGDCGANTWRAVARNLSDSTNGTATDGNTLFLSISGSYASYNPIVRCFYQDPMYSYYHYNANGQIASSASYTRYY